MYAFRCSNFRACTTRCKRRRKLRDAHARNVLGAGQIVLPALTASCSDRQAYTNLNTHVQLTISTFFSAARGAVLCRACTRVHMGLGRALLYSSVYTVHGCTYQTVQDQLWCPLNHLQALPVIAHERFVSRVLSATPPEDLDKYKVWTSKLYATSWT